MSKTKKLVKETETLVREFTVCAMEKHELREYNPDIIGDGTHSVELTETCTKCKLEVQFFWTTKYFSYAVIEPLTRYCLINRVWKYPVTPTQVTKGQW